MILVTAGAGGSGKTTIAAALGVCEARRGTRAVVVTIDPARRLADALGLAELNDEPERVELDAPGSLFAMMLAQKPAWDRMIARRAPSAAVHQRILGNRFYQHLSSDFAGAHAYAAIDMLCTLEESREWDTIIVDTPPIRHAVDFFRAPSRILSLLEKNPLDAAGRTVQWVLGRLQAAAGTEVLHDAIELLSAFREMLHVFRARAVRMQEILRGRDLGCVLVSTPDQRALDEALRFLSTAEELELRTEALLVNRSALASVGPDGADVWRELVAGGVEPRVASWVCANFDRWRERAAGEQARLDRFLALRPVRHVLVPELEADVHDLAGLVQLGRYLSSGLVP